MKRRPNGSMQLEYEASAHLLRARALIGICLGRTKQCSAHRPGQDCSHAALALSERRRTAREAARHLTAIRRRLVWGRWHRQRCRPQPATVISTNCLPQVKTRVLIRRLIALLEHV